MSIEAFVVMNQGARVASYSTQLGEKKAFQFAKQNTIGYGGIILARDSDGELNAVDYSKYREDTK